MSDCDVITAVLDLAKEQGATYPVFADSSSGEAVIVDTDSGRTWRVTLEEF